MTINKPTPAQIREAILDWMPANKVSFDREWNTRGRPWEYGLRGAVEHHISGVGDGAVEWCDGRSEGYNYPCCNEVVRRDGSVIIMSALSCWHSGKGGPWPAYGVPKDLGHLMLWGREHESWGTKQDFTDEMFDSTARMDSALRQVSNWENFNHLINHKGWTDGGPEMGLSYYHPTRGRKNDTLYDISVFRTNAQKMWETKHAPAPKPPVPPKPVPKPDSVVDLSNIQRAARRKGKDVDVLLVTKGLRAVGITRGIRVQDVFDESVRVGYALWQRRLGYTGTDADGIPGMTSLSTLGSKSKLFKVVL